MAQARNRLESLINDFNHFPEYNYYVQTGNVGTATTWTTTSATTTANSTGSVTYTINQPFYTPTNMWDYQPTTTIPYEPLQFPQPTGLPFIGNATSYATTYGFKPYECYNSSEGRITDGKKSLIFKIFEITNMDYFALIKHLCICSKLFNTLLLEFTMQHRTKQFMELFSKVISVTPEKLFNEVIKVYK